MPADRLRVHFLGRGVAVSKKIPAAEMRVTGEDLSLIKGLLIAALSLLCLVPALLRIVCLAKLTPRFMRFENFAKAAERIRICLPSKRNPRYCKGFVLI